mmetsp:Transcript_195/g.639  ORF Transcript_195/g.639 Transcript_195/m.639 type:complete len:203 (+) Transcript_195:542-1150(+)
MIAQLVRSFFLQLQCQQGVKLVFVPSLECGKHILILGFPPHRSGHRQAKAHVGLSGIHVVLTEAGGHTYPPRVVLHFAEGLQGPLRGFLERRRGRQCANVNPGRDQLEATSHAICTLCQTILGKLHPMVGIEDGAAMLTILLTMRRGFFALQFLCVHTLLQSLRAIEPSFTLVIFGAIPTFNCARVEGTLSQPRLCPHEVLA